MTSHHNHDGNAATNLHPRADSQRDWRSTAARNLGRSTRIGVSEAANHHAFGAAGVTGRVVGDSHRWGARPAR
jgi:hypothetical protein